MGSVIVRTLGAVGAAVLSVAMFGAGVACASDQLIGKTYSEASAYISQYKGKPVIATVTGDQLEIDECIVTSWQMSKFLNSSGKNERGNEWRLSLNCNNPLAAPGKPGNSAMSPGGVNTKTEEHGAEYINENPSVCDQDKDHKDWCVTICARTKLCEVMS
jgi:hypothetical protein